jgi:hypothetical protein
VRFVHPLHFLLFDFFNSSPKTPPKKNRIKTFQAHHPDRLLQGTQPPTCTIIGAARGGCIAIQHITFTASSQHPSRLVLVQPASGLLQPTAVEQCAGSAVFQRCWQLLHLMSIPARYTYPHRSTHLAARLTTTASVRRCLITPSACSCTLTCALKT